MPIRGLVEISRDPEEKFNLFISEYISYLMVCKWQDPKPIYRAAIKNGLGFYKKILVVFRKNYTLSSRNCIIVLRYIVYLTIFSCTLIIIAIGVFLNCWIKN